MSYARATSWIVSSGSLTSTTPPRPDQYLVLEASIDMTRSVAGAPAASSAAATAWCWSVRAVHVAWTASDPRMATPIAKAIVAPPKTRSATSLSHDGRRAASQPMAMTMPSSARM